MSSILAALDPAAVSAAARTETRNREVHLPPVSIYRWWARRTEAVNGAVLDAAALTLGRPRLTVVDPFAGGGVIPLCAVRRGHEVFAQDLDAWAALGLRTALELAPPAVIAEQTRALLAATEPLAARAYGTTFSDGRPARIAHSFRVGTAQCTRCGVTARLFPHALVSLKRRKERGDPAAWLATADGQLFEGRADAVSLHPVTGEAVDPARAYLTGRKVHCPCGQVERLSDRAETWSWQLVLVERTAGRDRELAVPTESEALQACASEWAPSQSLPAIPEGQETAVLRRHGFRYWHDLYPARQRVVLEESLRIAAGISEAMRLLVLGTVEMAGHCSRWDRYYLKSFEAMAGHRFNFTTLTVEPNVLGTPASGRGTVLRRARSFQKAAAWLHADERGRASVRQGDSRRLERPTGWADLVLTDPPYHDDVQYDELSRPFRAWAGLSSGAAVGSAAVNPTVEASMDSYEAVLTGIFTECHRVLDAEGHLIFSYANRRPSAWIALLGALEAAGFHAAGYALVHAENECDISKRSGRGCTFDLLLELRKHPVTEVHRQRPTSTSDEARFCHAVGEAFAAVGALPEGWRPALHEALATSAFVSPARSSRRDGGSAR